MSTSEESIPAPAEPKRSGTRDGRTFVILALSFLVVFVGFLLLVSPRLQDGLGLNQPLPFNTPPQPTEVPLRLGDRVVGTAIWDASGVCAEVRDSSGTTFRTCAVPDPLRPIWAIDAPDEAAEPFLLIATPPDVASLEGRTTAGETFAALVQARELPAAWAVIALPEGAAVGTIRAYNSSASDVGGAECGVEDAPPGGSARLSGGCLVPQED